MPEFWHKALKSTSGVAKSDSKMCLFMSIGAIDGSGRHSYITKPQADVIWRCGTPGSVADFLIA